MCVFKTIFNTIKTF